MYYNSAMENLTLENPKLQVPKFPKTVLAFLTTEVHFCPTVKNTEIDQSISLVKNDNE